MSVRYQPNSPHLLFNSSSSSSTTPPMAKQSQHDIDQMIQRAQPTSRDLVRRDIVQALQSPLSSLLLKVVPYYYNDGTSKELLCLNGTVQCQYRGNRYNIPIEIWFQQDHPHVAPLAYVKPTQDMYVSTSSQDVQPDGTVVLPYLKKWRHPNSDMNSLLQAMSEAFSRSPPVYSGGASRASQPPTGASMSTPYPSSTPYPVGGTSMPTPMGMASPSPSYPYGYPQASTNIPSNVYRDSLQTAVLDKIRERLNDMTQFSRVQIDSLRKTEQDLNDGHFKIQSFIQNMQQQQSQAQNYLSNLQTKIAQLNEATQKMSMSSSSSSLPSKEQTIKDDAILTPAPVYKQLLQCYSEEHAIQDLLFYLADGLRRESIGLDIYLKHVRELSRRQFVLRATMQKCRQVAGLTSR